MGVAPTAIASASVSCLSSSSLLSVKKNRSHMRLLALHCNPRLVFCHGHFLMLPLHNNGTKIGMDNDQSCAPQLPVSLVWCSHASRLAHLISVILVLRVLRVHGLDIVFNAIC